MFQKYFYIINYLLIIVVGCLYFFKIKDSKPLVLFYGFLIYSLITEILGSYFWWELRISTGAFYNTWNLVAFLFYSYFFLNYLKSSRRRFFVKLFVVNVLALFAINALFYQDFFTDVFRYNNVFQKLLISITIMMYFGELLKSDSIVYFKKSMSFWIAIVVLLYSVGLIPIFVIGELIEYQGVFRYVIILLNFVMSIGLITGFVVSKKEYNI